ncbi:MAG: CvpA family protein [Hydrogenophaga sp.]|nr:CvpA family protein [Hydrogenophaga sp.]
MLLTDWVLLALLVLSVLLGLWRGLMFEVLSVAGWVVAFFVAQAWADDVVPWLPIDRVAPPLQLAIGFALVFIVIAFVGGLVAWLVQKFVASAGLRPVDRVLGGAFGLVRGAIILLAITLVITITQMQTARWWSESPTAGVLSHTLHSVKPLLPDPLARHIP